MICFQLILASEFNSLFLFLISRKKNKCQYDTFSESDNVVSKLSVPNEAFQFYFINCDYRDHFNDTCMDLTSAAL